MTQDEEITVLNGIYSNNCYRLLNKTGGCDKKTDSRCVPGTEGEFTKDPFMAKSPPRFELNSPFLDFLCQPYTLQQ